MTAETLPLVVPLTGLDRTQLEAAGGKAANLGELVRAGFPVPPGFCVTTAAYALATEGGALAPVLEALAHEEDVARLGALAGRARDAILAAPVPPAVADAALRAHAEQLGGAPVAVRSSATAEDLPEASFAGQQETYLHVMGEAALLDAIRRAWASLWTDRAVVYRARNAVDPRTVRLAVVVQRMVRAEVAGVLFTADPVTGRRGRAVVDASPGLGEAVVSGAVDPDHFEVDMASGTIAARRIGDKATVIEADERGGTRRIRREGAAGEPCLSDDEVRALAALGARVEARWGAPQDIEWALDERRAPWLLQTRPITTLFPLPERVSPSDTDLRVYLSFNVAQGVFGPLTPMGHQAFRMFSAGIAAKAGFRVASPEAGISAITEAAGRMFLDLTPLLRHSVGRRLVAFAFARVEARSAAHVERLLADPRLAPRPVPARRLVARIARALARTRAPLTMARALLRPEAARVRCARRADEALALGEVAGGAQDPEARLAAIERLFYEGFTHVFVGCLPTVATGMLCMRLSRALLDGLATPQEIEVALRALPHNPTTEMDLELWSIAVRLREDAALRAEVRGTPPPELAAAWRRRALPRALQSGLDAFLARYGARGVAEIDVGVPRWADDPTHLFGVLANYLALDDDAASPERRFGVAAREAESMVAELARRARTRGRLRGALAALALRRTRQLAGLREAPKFYAVRLLARARALLLEVAAGLVAAGRLDAAEDIFMLRFAEVRAAVRGAGMSHVAAARRAAHERELRRRHIPRILLSDGTDLDALAAASAPPGTGELRGSPASAGRVTARARVVLDPTGAKLEPGEILVAPSTDPGWTPLFLTAGGLVMEMGGSMSHGAVVAREYGIPAVVGVAHATERIRTGETITVDGAAGTIIH